jgi:hypothetical protein
MKEYLKLAVFIVVLGVAFTSATVQAESHNGAKKDKVNTHNLKPHGKQSVAIGGIIMPIKKNPDMSGANTHGLNPGANSRAALANMNQNDRSIAARVRHEERMAERDVERAVLAAEKAAANEMRLAEQEALRAAKARNSMADDAGVVTEPVITDPTLAI